MHFRSISDISRVIRQNLHLIPESVDVVVGVPRSGMLPASMISLHLHLPLTDVEGLISGRLMRSGTTRGNKVSDFANLKHALVVDDSVYSGGTYETVRLSLSNTGFKNLTFCSVFGSDNYKSPDMITFENVPSPRAFEWNIMYHPFILKNACVDIDGILCFDPDSGLRDGGEMYRAFLRNARQRYIPHGEIGTLVTSRLEKYRDETTEWLESRGIRYRNLYMLDLPDEKTRRKLGQHAKFKAEVYRHTNAYVFIESEEWQAREIANLSGRPALSLSENPKIFYGSTRHPRGIVWAAKRNRIIRKIFRKSR